MTSGAQAQVNNLIDENRSCAAGFSCLIPMIDLPAATLERLMEARDASIGVKQTPEKN